MGKMDGRDRGDLGVDISEFLPVPDDFSLQGHDHWCVGVADLRQWC